MKPPRIFDGNVHFRPAAIGLNVDAQTAEAARGLRTEADLQPEEFLACLESSTPEFRAGFDRANFMFFNTELAGTDKLAPVVARIEKDFPGSVCTALLDFRRPDCAASVRNLKSLGFRGVKFHPYAQQIENEEMSRILAVCEEAESLGLVIQVCTSFGTAKMHRHDGLGLACRISEVVSRVPLVLLHSGGLRCMEAFLLAEDKPNVILETSFSLNYWSGSRLMEDFMFAFKRLGPDRVMYGSDFPYVSCVDAQTCLTRELERHAFSSADMDAVFFATAARVFGSQS